MSLRLRRRKPLGRRPNSRRSLWAVAMMASSTGPSMGAAVILIDPDPGGGGGGTGGGGTGGGGTGGTGGTGITTPTYTFPADSIMAQILASAPADTTANYPYTGAAAEPWKGSATLYDPSLDTWLATWRRWREPALGPRRPRPQPRQGVPVVVPRSTPRRSSRPRLSAATRWPTSLTRSGTSTTTRGISGTPTATPTTPRSQSCSATSTGPLACGHIAKKVFEALWNGEGKDG